jgi:ABC-type molybdenum transport system ATPase subunit/photorepair protein PhrA
LSDVLLSNAAVDPTFEILDEPTQHLSTEGVRDLCDYLSDRAKNYDRQVWFVDHHAIESARFSSTMTVVKDVTGSHIEGVPYVKRERVR